MQKRTASGGSVIVTAFLLGLLGIVVAGSPATANDGNCGPGDLCLWQDENMSGGRWDDSGYVADYSSGHRWWGTEQSINDQASSARSRYSFWVAKVHEHSYYRGRHVRLYPGGEIGHLVDYEFNDVASSNYW